ncbi:hypothetical protein psal_cds_273 [Pandoravirus salinus]|uniref:Uncharacterized protein n=1 Tax=Pandoravirus salinus TaxID=1349410 RepID=S4VU28_9VIRU|nr:hypothetical protein psal_cds_273 [Pandoravirus salinus]AGO83853.1 hypothetical protein psal_cds_273 [Pandoravirus salinus]
MSSTVGSSSNNRTRRGARANIGQGSLRPINEATLGLPVVPGAGLAQQQGRYLGFGTTANAGEGFFNNKLQIVITQEVADRLNEEMAEDLNALQTAAGVPADEAPFLSAGLYGPIGSQGQVQAYLPNLTEFYQDDRAEIYVPADARDAAIGLVVPGSFRQLQALQAGVPAGQVRVKNPNNRTGYLKVGSKGWMNFIRAAAAGRTPSSRDAVENVIGQGALYGLAPIFRDNNINVALVGNYDQATGAYLGDANGNVRFALVAPATVESVASDAKFRRDVANWYANFGVDPGDQAKGAYGAASLGLKHAGRTVGPNGETDVDAVSQNIINQFRETGSARGAFGWAPEYALPQARRGLTAFPLQDANGNPLANPSDPSGQCTYAAAGPGVTQDARANGSGFGGKRFYRNMRQHVGTGLNDAGADIALPTFSCGRTSDFVTNLNRNVYQAGGARALANQSAIDQLAERNELMNQYFAATGGEEFTDMFSPDAQAATYVQWLNDPEGTEGTSPFFMVPANQGRGFSFAGPALWEQDMDPATARAFAGVDVRQGSKARFANAVADRLANPGAYQAGALPIAFGKPGGPSGAANPIFQ